jgi:hypothetical protein
MIEQIFAKSPFLFFHKNIINRDFRGLQREWGFFLIVILVENYVDILQKQTTYFKGLRNQNPVCYSGNYRRQT